MNSIRTMTFVLLVSCLTAGLVQADLSDPFEILERHYQAIGGVDKVEALKTRHLEGTVVIEGTGFQGAFEEWGERPIKSRQEIDLTVFKITEGDNGEHSWRVDQNGRLQIRQDERSLKERQVKLLLAQFDHLNRKSPNFELSFEGVEKVGDVECYAVKMTNTINEDVTTSYYDKSSFYLLKAVAKKPDSEMHSLFSDYRWVDGVLIAFREETTEYPTQMKQIMEVADIETNVPIDPSIFEPPGEQAADFKFLNGFSAENVPFRFIEDHLFLEVELGGKKTLWVLDSGAGATVVETRFAEALGLEPMGTLKGKGAGSVVDVSFTKLPAFSLPGIEFGEQKVAMIDLHWLFSEWLGLDVAGILGFDFLSRMVTRIDYANELISFYHPDHFEYKGAGVVLDAPVSQSNSFHLPLTVDGKYRGMWNLDTGAGGMWFHYPFAEKHGLLDRPGVYGMGAGAGGSGTHLRVKFKTMEFAGMTIGNPIFSIPLGKGEGAFANEALTGNIGNSLLRHFVIYLDYKHGQVIVERGDMFGHAFPRDNSGLQIKKRADDELEVMFVAEGTPAFEAGFKEGDVIRSVNGIDSQYLGGLVSVREMLRDKPGTKYKIEVVREDGSRELKLALRDLYKR
ncbi:MAG: aspartyl protease family protein [Candidatus Zixiibacteriota bacterium]|nr:MAG: aspartyl protease family protein [candidate division Zixibacteria bacterium]